MKPFNSDGLLTVSLETSAWKLGLASWAESVAARLEICFEVQVSWAASQVEGRCSGQRTATEAAEEVSRDSKVIGVKRVMVGAELMVVPWLEIVVASINEAVAMTAVMEVENCILLSCGRAFALVLIV